MHNPRKVLRQNANLLGHEIKLLKSRLAKFELEASRLQRISNDGTEVECKNAAESWKKDNWVAFNS